MKIDNTNMTTFVLYFILLTMFFLITTSLFTPSRIENARGNVTLPLESPPEGGDLNRQRCKTYTLEGMTPYVMSNTLTETSKDHLEKITYMEDTCGNYMKSDYNSYIHSVPNALSAWLNRKTKQNITPESCNIYQTYITDICGNSSCDTICTNPNQYYDINTSSCKNCPIGYGVDKNSDNKCIPLETCPSDKKYTDNTGNCLPCPSGKKYDDGINCVNICLDYQSLNTDGTCSLTCPLRTQRWDPINNCVNCPAGYIADGHNNCVPAPTCPPGQVSDSNNNCVAKCTVDWEHYDATTNSCVQTCMANQYYNTTTNSCTDCPNGGRSDGNNGCLPGPTTPPLTCPAGYNLINNKCESYCPIWEKNNVLHPNMCDPICNRNTQYFNQTTYKCMDCPTGQISDGNNGCVLAPTPAPTPLVCTPGYAPNSSGTACNSICPPWRKNNQQNPSQCDLICPTSTNTYYDTTQFTCMTCPNGETADTIACVVSTTTAPAPATKIPINQPIPTAKSIDCPCDRDSDTDTCPCCPDGTIRSGVECKWDSDYLDVISFNYSAQEEKIYIQYNVQGFTYIGTRILNKSDNTFVNSIKPLTGSPLLINNNPETTVYTLYYIGLNDNSISTVNNFASTPTTKMKLYPTNLSVHVSSD